MEIVRYDTFMFFILIEKEIPKKGIIIVRIVDRKDGWHKMVGCEFNFNGTLQLKRQHFFYTDVFKGKKIPEDYNSERPEFYVFSFDPETERQSFIGIGEIPKLDTQLFYPSPDTEWVVWE
jgi:hypothetical protein